MKIEPVNAHDYPCKLVERIKMSAKDQSKNIPTWKFLSGWNLSEDQKIKRLFHFFESAVEAESKGKFIASSFFWESSMQISKKLKTEFRDDFLKNVFLKCMTGLINGYFENGESPLEKERILYFLEQIETTLSLLKSEGSEIEEWMLEIAKYVISQYDRLKETKKALDFSEEINGFYPQNLYFSQRLIELSLDAGIREMQDENKKSLHSNLNGLIAKIENHQFPEQIQHQAFETLGWLYYYYTIKLAAADNVSTALLAVRKAHAYHPQIEKLKESWDTLVTRMNNKKEDIDKTIESIKYNPRAHLTAAGQQIKRDADSGFSKVNVFIEKEEKEIVIKRENAYLFHLMNRIGIYDTLEEPRIENADRIYECINHVLNEPAITNQEVVLKLTRFLNEIPKIKDTIKGKVVEFVIRLLNNENPTVKNEEKEKNSNTFNSFFIKPPATTAKASSEPFVYWLFSSRDLWTKGIAVLGIFFILTLTLLYGINEYQLRQRNIAFKEMKNLLKQDGSYSQVLEEASTFLKNPPIFGEDQRTASVLFTYKQTLATWLITGNLSDKDKMQSYVNQLPKFNISKN